MSEIPCESCNELLDLDKKKPICLPCGHTLCKSCLNDIWKRMAYIKCPIDSKKHFLKLDDFPTNYLVLKLISNEKLANKTTTKNLNIGIVKKNTVTGGKLDSSRKTTGNKKKGDSKLDTSKLDTSKMDDDPEDTSEVTDLSFTNPKVNLFLNS